jgi:hypothetical protein
MSDKEQRKLIWILVWTPALKALWTLHPDRLLPADQIPTYKMFPFADIEISWPTYIYFIVLHIVQLVYVRSWWAMFERYRNVFTCWFWVEVIQFAEYFANYNEAQIWTYIGAYRLDIDFTLLKMAGLPIVFGFYEFIWRKR